MGASTRELRERRGAGAQVSQKALLEQEGLALALWLLDDPSNDEDLERGATAHDAYCADQLAGAAAALRRRRRNRSCVPAA